MLHTGIEEKNLEKGEMRVTKDIKRGTAEGISHTKGWQRTMKFRVGGRRTRDWRTRWRGTSVGGKRFPRRPKEERITRLAGTEG